MKEHSKYRSYSIIIHCFCDIGPSLVKAYLLIETKQIIYMAYIRKHLI